MVEGGQAEPSLNIHAHTRSAAACAWLNHHCTSPPQPAALLEAAPWPELAEESAEAWKVSRGHLNI